MSQPSRTRARCGSAHCLDRPWHCSTYGNLLLGPLRRLWRTRQPNNPKLRAGGCGRYCPSIATWRSVSAKRQADIALLQADIAQTSLSDDRFARAIELLSGDDEIRAAALYVLGQLAVDDPERYGKQVRSIVDGLSAQLRRELGDAVRRPVTSLDLALIAVRKELDSEREHRDDLPP